MYRRLVHARNRVLGLGLVVMALSLATACAARAPVTQSSPIPSFRITAIKATPSPSCALSPAIVPTLPPVTPVFAALDPTTGLHITGLPQTVDLASYRLEVSGKVDHPLQLSYDDLRCMPKVEKQPQLVCRGYFVDSANWGGVSVGYVLGLAGVQKDATSLKLIGADGYSNSVQLTVTDSDDNFLAYELEGQTLPRLHGFPLRAVFSHLNGNTWVKWLVRLEVH
jgi:DMSO/TMAO reductase YedYZ molybdopterin-dependent catalytic subunit